MSLSDHYRGGATERLMVTIITVDPPNSRVEVVGKDAAVIQISVLRAPALFRWPIQGEFWTIIRENGEWALEEKVQDPDSTSLRSLEPGEALIQSNTIWTPNGEKLIKTGDVAGGVLSGEYPNPGFAVDMATQAELDALDTRLDILEARPVPYGPYQVIVPSLETSLAFASISLPAITALIDVPLSSLTVQGSLADIASQNWPAYIGWGYEWNSGTGVLTVEFTNQWSGATGPTNETAWRGSIWKW